MTFALSAASGRGWCAVQLPVGKRRYRCPRPNAYDTPSTGYHSRAATYTHYRVPSAASSPARRIAAFCRTLPSGYTGYYYSCLEYRPLETPSATSGPPGDSRGCPCLGICSLTLSPGRGSAHSLKCSIGCGWQLAYHRCHTYNQIEALATTRARPTATFGLPRSPTWLTTNSYICNTVRNVATAYNISRVGGNSRIPDCT